MEHSKITNSTSNVLPIWNLNSLYPSMDSPELKKDLEKVAEKSLSFETRYKTKVSQLTGPQLAHSIVEYEKIEEILGRIMSFAQLIYSGDMLDNDTGNFHQSMHEEVTRISSHLLFFNLELNIISDADLKEKLKSPELNHYYPWLRDLRVFQPHQLDDQLEKLFLEKNISGRAAWTRLFDEKIAELSFSIDGVESNLAEALDKLSNKNAKTRKNAAKEISSVLKKHVRLFSLITNTLSKDKAIEDNWRGYEKPISARNRVNQVEDNVVNALVETVSSNYQSLSHRYYALKAEWMGVEHLNYWDRNAPLPGNDDTTIEWSEAKEIVLEAYESFSPTMASIGKEFFDKNWIAAPTSPGKASGAFSHPTVPSSNPFILLNYQGKLRDVMTLAHELGHGVHQVLAARQGCLMADTPLTLAETASVFGEMLTFQSLLERHKGDSRKRKLMIASKVEDMLNTVVRQIAFHEFETSIHDKRRSGELSPEEIGDIWISIQERSLGPAIKLNDDYRVFWTYIPHFIHSPFYVYAYAFGDCLVNSLYAVFRDEGSDFAEKYIDMLKAGGTMRHQELLIPFKLDASEPTFWKKGLLLIEDLITELADD